MNLFRQPIGVAPEYYLTQSPLTDPGPFCDLYMVLPDQVTELVEVIHGLLLHIFLAKHYGVDLTEQQRTEVQSRFVTTILEKILSKDSSSLTQSRTLEHRFIGNCRDHAV
ncbi:MAG TPA: hypothetical protein VEC37_10345, partial [Bacillota bacterium]|nr:hypothetical protein [Bacillota bacterium]